MKHTIHFVTTEGIRQNLSELTGVSVDAIDDFVESVEGWEYSGRDYRDIWGDFKRTTGCFDPVIRKAVLFHGCRCLPTTDFREGLLPNDLAIDLIWKQVFDAVSEQLSFGDWREWKNDFLTRCPGTYLDRVRSSTIRERGPWGKFVREE